MNKNKPVIDYLENSEFKKVNVNYGSQCEIVSFDRLLDLIEREVITKKDFFGKYAFRQLKIERINFNTHTRDFTCIDNDSVIKATEDDWNYCLEIIKTRIPIMKTKTFDQRLRILLTQKDDIFRTASINVQNDIDKGENTFVDIIYNLYLQKKTSFVLETKVKVRKHYKIDLKELKDKRLYIQIYRL